MTVQLAAGAFNNTGIFADGSPIALNDGPINSVAGQSSPWLGATNITPVALGPPVGQKWSVLSVSIVFGGLIIVPSANLNPFGRLGAIWASLIRSSGTNGYVRPMQAFPTDKTQLTKLWDGTVDPPFRIYNGTIGGTVPATVPTIAGGLQLPVPIKVNPGEQLAVGLWLTPSLTADIAQMFILNASYSVAYDDGRN